MGNEVKHLFFHAGGNTAVFDRGGHQMPDLQKSWLLLFLEFLQGKGVQVEDIEEIKLPDGSEAEYLKELHSWRIK